MLAKARIVNYDHNCSFIVLATVITIVNYDRHLFTVQATDLILGGKDRSLSRGYYMSLHYVGSDLNCKY
jgi:hypothetical protein